MVGGDSRIGGWQLFESRSPEPKRVGAEPSDDMDNVAERVFYNIGQREELRIFTSLACRERRTLFHSIPDTG